MKKWLIAAAVFVLIIVVFLTVFIVIKLAPFGAKEEPSSGTAAFPAEYAQKNYPDYQSSYDPEQKLLTLKKQTDFSLASASAIYTDDKTYATQVRLLALDILAACDDPEIEVVLQYVSRDGEPMYSISSTGRIIRYWEEDPAA